MKFKKTRTGAVTAAAAVAALVVGGSAAGAAGGSTGYLFVGWAGGSIVRALDNTVTSDLTAESSINNEGLVSATNDAAGVTVTGLLNLGAVTTSAKSTAIPGGYQVRSESETANVSALGGAITADAIDTVSIARVVDGVASTEVHTTFVNLKVGTVNVPIHVGPNTIIRIPNIATVGLNFQMAAATGNQGFTIGIGAYVSLLKPAGNSGAGASVSIAPTTAQIGPVVVPPSDKFLHAKAYGTAVHAKVGSLAEIHSDPTAPIGMPALGTGGDVRTKSIAGVNLNPLATVGAIKDTVQGVNTEDEYDAKATSTIGAINLLGGLITADAVASTAHVFGPAGSGLPTVNGSATIVNLVINGTPIDLNTGPNTIINIPNIVKVTINQQMRSPVGITVRALDIQLLAAKSGFPAGAEIEVAVSKASATG
jgi:hypothetical protein